MKKKVKDLTAEEIMKICNENFICCEWCPLQKVTGIGCLIRKEPFLWNEYLDDSIEVKEYD